MAAYQVGWSSNIFSVQKDIKSRNFSPIPPSSPCEQKTIFLSVPTGKTRSHELHILGLKKNRTSQLQKPESNIPITRLPIIFKTFSPHKKKSQLAVCMKHESVVFHHEFENTFVVFGYLLSNAAECFPKMLKLPAAMWSIAKWMPKSTSADFMSNYQNQSDKCPVGM